MAEAAAWAERCLDGVLRGDAETVALPFPEEHFDCLVFADALEHMVRPEVVLKRLLPFLKPGGEVVISLPNVRHYTVVGDLFINGAFTYQDEGILDRTHLRFFTFQEIETLLEGAGLNWATLDANLGMEHPAVFEAMAQSVRLMGGDEAKFRAEAPVIQYLVRARKPLPGEPVIRGPWREPAQASPAAPDAEPMASIVILTYNQLAHTERCIESLLAHTGVPFELIAIDNASSDGTPAYWRALAAKDPRVKAVLNAENRGFAFGCNQGIALSSAPVVVLLNNDTVLTPGWLEGLIRPMLEHPEIAATGPRTNRIPGWQQLNFAPYGADLEAMQRFAAWYTQAHARQATVVQRAVGFCLAVRRDALEKIGGLDPRFGRGNFEDDDFCLRLMLAGYRIAIAQESFVHHVGSASFDAGSESYHALLQENYARFTFKWEISPSPDGSYPAPEILGRPFDALRHTVPLCVPESAPFGLEEARARRFLLVAEDRHRDAMLAAVRRYQERFSAQDDTTLVVWTPPERVRDLNALVEAIAPLCDRPDAADVYLLAQPLSPLAVGGLFTGVEAYVDLGNSEIAGWAQAACCPRFEADTLHV